MTLLLSGGWAFSFLLWAEESIRSFRALIQQNFPALRDSLIHTPNLIMSSPSTSQRVTRSRRGNASTMDTIDNNAPFAIGVGGGSTASSSTTRQRSTRRGARNASARIAEELAPQRRSTRLAASRSGNNSTTNNSGGRDGALTTTTTATRASSALSSPARNARRGTTKPSSSSPIDLCDTDTEDEMDLKPAAKKQPAAKKPDTSSEGEDFTCAICLDAPPSMTDVASISGCSHKFCFDCIDKWALTENKCPCCKARFNKIDRVVPLTLTPERRGKRKRSSSAAASSSTSSGGGGSSSNTRRRTSLSSSPRNNRRVNSRTVEDRNQQLPAIPIDAALVQQILASFTSQFRNASSAAAGGSAGAGAAAGGGGGGARGGGPMLPGQVTFGTSEDGRPQIRMIRPNGGGMVGVMEMHFPDMSLGTGPAAASARGRGGASSSSARGSTGSARGSARSGQPRARDFTSAPAEAASSTGGSPRVRFGFARASSSSGSRRNSSGSLAGGSPPPARPGASSRSAAGQSGISAFASLFASLGGGGASMPRGSSPARGGRAWMGSPSRQGAAARANGSPHRSAGTGNPNSQR